MYTFHYVDRKEGEKFGIFARERKTADEIAQTANKFQGYNMKPRIFRFKTPFETNCPPYELEQAQLECAQETKTARNKAKGKTDAEEESDRKTKEIQNGSRSSGREKC